MEKADAGRPYTDMIESLIALKTKAEAYFGSEVTGAVIVTPTDLTNVRRMKDVCDEAGLNVLRFINPGAAVTLACVLERD
jgi:molecular chaperone DnaK (HSP70)